MPSAVISSRGAVSALRFGRAAAMGTLAALILIAGVWASWGTAQHVMLTKGRESGTVRVARCAEDVCTGPYTPVSRGSQPRQKVVIAHTASVREGLTYSVVVKPGSSHVVRSGPAGILYAWVPFGGALLLAAVVVAGGLRRARPAWAMAGTGIALITGAFVTM
ncbi:hypothetical protein QNN03_14065 [Streptomyces sp. GXMU-J15]|uniref:Uncharacterized protein n=1 Tax=Streptomyces fuscus TaxID=3048495 RepID=A0ABT7IZI6_9ACTN|nr:hypothetical protein [Streptomyces fuscus]MDL2077561.1 hypothetical protein [Streptomyces fuscus]